MLTVSTIGAAGGVLLFLLVLAVGTCLIYRKRQVDELQEKAGRAGGVAQRLGFKFFDDLLFAISAGNMARIWSILKQWVREYCTSDDGPKKLARDVIISCYPTIRDDATYGNEVREAVVSAALGFSKDDQQKDVDFSKASGRLDKIGWTKAAAAGHALATKNYRTMAASIVSLCNEVMEEHGEKEIALRVSRPTLDVLFNDRSYRDKIIPLLREYVAKDDAEQAAAQAKAIAEAKAILAAEAKATA